MLICVSLFTLVCFQTGRFAVVLDHQSMTSASVDNDRLREFGANAVRQLSTYLRM